MLLSLSNDVPEGSSECCFQRFQSERVFERLRALDARARAGGLEALDPASEPLIRIGMELDDSGRVTKNSYGVFNLSWQAEQHPEWADQVLAEVDAIRAGIKETHKVPLRFLIWAGMGGSAEDKSLYNAAAILRRGPRCYVLDSTDPAKLRYILEDIERRHGLSMNAILRSTLVVGMAMGMTSYEPVINLDKIRALYEKYHVDARPNILYMTLPGSLLDEFGRRHGFRRIGLQLDGANSTAGRHSGPLTRGSLYPLALARADLRAWIAATFLSEQNILTAWRLASFIHAQGAAGRDKLTLLLPKPWAGAAIWTKQDFEESLGKCEHLGLKVIVGDKPRLADYRSPREPAQDRAFLAVQIRGTAGPDARKLSLLRRAGYPVATLAFPHGASLAAYMQFIHYTVFGVAYLRNMNFVTQPSVELYKAIANRIHGEAEKAGGVRQTRVWQSIASSPNQAKFTDALTLHFDRLCLDVRPDGTDAAVIYAAIIKRLIAERRVEYAELTFFGDTRYAPQGAAVRKRLQHAAEQLFARRLKMPADVYEGPAMNHSYHEMIIGHGRCFSTVLLSEKQEQFAQARYSSDYHVAQFLATQAALAERQRPVVALTLKNLEEPTLRALDDFFRHAATHLKGRL